ncbi:MAG: hypothetical protein J0L75_01440 [Spirochaetes bacterium]|nr:hypothetical protein [Spirochaetota bacterium]
MAALGVLALAGALLLSGCGQCQVGPRCVGLTQDQVDTAINYSNAAPWVRRAYCDRLSFSQTASWGAGCVVEWR